LETGGCRIELSGDLRMGVQVVPNIKPDREATPFSLETDLFCPQMRLDGFKPSI